MAELKEKTQRLRTHYHLMAPCHPTSTAAAAAAIFACRLKGGHGANKEQNKLR